LRGLRAALLFELPLKQADAPRATLADKVDYRRGCHHRGVIGWVVSQLHSGWFLGT